MWASTSFSWGRITHKYGYNLRKFIYKAIYTGYNSIYN